MSVHVVSNSESYQVVDDVTVSVSVTIGDAQGGGWVVAWDPDHVLAKGSDTTVVPVGRGAEIKGKKLQVVVTAVDVRPETNHLSCTVTLNGGAAGKKNLVSTWNDGADGDAAVFSTVIGFV